MVKLNSKQTESKSNNGKTRDQQNTNDIMENSGGVVIGGNKLLLSRITCMSLLLNNTRNQ